MIVRLLRSLLLMCVLALVMCMIAHAEVSPKQRYANALAYALQWGGNQGQHIYLYSGIHCAPVANAKFAGAQVFICFIKQTMIRTGHTRKGYAFFLPDGTQITRDEAKTALEASRLNA